MLEPIRHPSAARRGFTLFEVAIALLLLAVGVTTVLMIFPVGIRAQQMARFQLLAAAKAQEMVESFAASHNLNPAIDVEAPDPWDVAVGYRCLAPDLESRLATHSFGIMPLPTAIARRLDADGDEIQRLLDDGGYLYYSQPMATTNMFQSSLTPFPPGETQKLVFAVVGAAQANALHLFPWKAWPYEVPYPSPPIHGVHRPEYVPSGASTYVASYGGAAGPSFCWEPWADPADDASREMAKVFDWAEPDGTRYGYKPYCYTASGPDGGDGFPGATADFSFAGATRYLQSALWYAKRIGLGPGFYDPPAALTTFTAAGSEYREVLAMRFLAHAATCITRWKTKAELDAGVGIPSATLDGLAGPAIRLTHDGVVRYHESCLALVMRYATRFPYDWGAPRPTQRATLMDAPLIEWDLFGPTLSGTIAGSTVAARQWRPLAAQPIRHLGRSYQFPDRDIDPAVFSTASGRFSLTARFAPEDRCRQLVFWAVDWQAYEDAELAPSAAVDASKYPIAAPLAGADFDRRMDWFEFASSQLYAFRNPEKVMVFFKDVADRATGADVADAVQNQDYQDSRDRGVGGAAVFSGLYGADRNFNRRLDRGPVPATTRMRAMPVARFNFYDQRLPVVIR